MSNKRLFFVLILVIITFSEKLELYKGQLHCHSTQSDGTYDPDTVASRYKRSGYDFISLTDHSMFTDISHWNSKDFLTIPGDEISSDKNHVNAFDFTFVPIVSVGLQGNIDAAIDANSAFIQVNHPYSSGHTHQSLMQTTGFSHLELFNSKHYGAEGYSTEIWDTLLSNGRLVYGTAADDFHYDFNNLFNKNWVEVFSLSLNKNEIIRAINSGDFIACNGRSLINAIDYFESVIEVEAVEPSRVRFYGANGILLKDTIALNAQCSTIGQQYVRAVVSDTLGNATYTQPRFLATYSEAAGMLMGDSVAAKDGSFFVELGRPTVSYDSVALLYNDSLIAVLGNEERSYQSEAGVVLSNGVLRARYLSVDGRYYWSDSKRVVFATSVQHDISVGVPRLDYRSQDRTLLLERWEKNYKGVFSVFSLQGRMISQEKISGREVVLPLFSSGVYVVQIRVNDASPLTMKVKF